MPIGITREYGKSGIPVWQGTGKDIQLAQGGFKLDITGLILGTWLPAGTAFDFNEATRLAKPAVLAKAQATLGAVTAYRVEKGSNLKVGQYLGTGAAGGPAYAITAIDTTNADYDLVTVGTTIGAVTAGDTFYVSSATGASAGAYPAMKGLLYDDTLVREGEDVSVVIVGTVYARRIPYTSAIETALANSNYGKIIFSQSK